MTNQASGDGLSSGYLPVVRRYQERLKPLSILACSSLGSPGPGGGRVIGTGGKAAGVLASGAHVVMKGERTSLVSLAKCLFLKGTTHRWVRN